MKNVILLLSLAVTNNVFAHGENKFGPNKGYIRMPGTFHTELVPQSNNIYNIYLIDLSNKNPVVENSSVALEYKNHGKTISFNCLPSNDHFVCNSKEKIDQQNGELVVEAKRLGKKGNSAKYELPLNLNYKMKEESGHDMKNMHH
jgi:hypothetical protein